MPYPLPRLRIVAAALTVLALPACAGTYTGPVEVTRFLAEDPAGLGSGTIATIVDPTTPENLRTSLYRDAVAAQLGELGYQPAGGDATDQVATVGIERSQIDGAGRRSPVTVGGSAGTGSFGSGVGLGIGINLGGGGNGPREVTQLSVRISSRSSGATLWEGRAELATSLDSPYAPAAANANALAAALFKDFPGGNGETVTIAVDELEGTQ